MSSVDLNADLGEGFGIYRCGDDDAMLSLVTSANVACGLHAGDPDIMARTFALARERGVAVGAHPGYADLAGFGRRRIPLSAAQIEHLFAYQVGAAQALAAYAGHRLTYVKAHGALANLACIDLSVADAIARAVKAVDPALALLAIALTEQVRAGERAGLRTVQEIFADRGYDDAGQLVPRRQPGDLIDDADLAARGACAMVEDGAIISGSGKRLRTPIESICVHGDSVHAVETAKAVRRRLEQAGVTVAPFGTSS